MSFSVFEGQLGNSVRCCGGSNISLLTGAGKMPARNFNFSACAVGGNGVEGHKFRLALSNSIVVKGS